MTSKVSVIVPCYNQAQYMEETLTSVYKQTYTNWECIIVDDGSTDNSKVIAKKWCEKDGRFQYVYKENGGLSSARNFGLKIASGQYVQFLDSDDLIKPEKFSEQLKDLQESEISISNYFSFIDGTNDAALHRYLSPFLSETHYKKELILDWEYRKSIPCHSVLFERRLIVQNNLSFNENLPNHEDWVFWVQLFYFSNSIKNNKNEFALYRIHNRSMSVDFKLMKQGFLQAAKILETFFKDENNETLYKLSKEKYKEIYEKNRVPFLKQVKSKIYSKLAFITDMSEKIKPIAIHLPQFHPTPENDEWWGKGFTEWTNVTKTTPRFEGHYQPHLPADLGFYDLRLEEARLAQEALAKLYGIHGFCYYHYWFNGKKMLYEPLDRKLKNPKEDFPFMMCWANEDWTRAWEASENKMLLKQDYGFDDDLNHIKHLVTYFKDTRYITVQEKPVFIVYRPELFPDIKKTIQIWRDEARKAGLPGLYLGYAQKSQLDFLSAGFDFAFEFQPNFGRLPKPMGNHALKRIKSKVLAKMGFEVNGISSVYDYDAYVKAQKNEDFKAPVYPGITPMWDNSARKNKAFILHKSSPEKYKKWLIYIKENYPWNKVPENFVFINAWNEWAEGNHLEPCQKWETSYLEATKEVLNNV